jgi:hypothetical protein
LDSLKIDRQSYFNTITMPTIYLSGPIAGTSFDDCTNWRNYVAKELNEFRCLDPTRGKSYLKGAGPISDEITKNTKGFKEYLASDQAIMTRDSWDSFTCDAMFVNFLYTNKVSIGTCMEVAWGFQRRIPIIICINDDNLHNHPMIRAASPFQVPDLDTGIRLLKTLFVIGRM